MARSFRPQLEELESRCVPATWANPWPVPQHLTLSFAPDGTQVGTDRSDLFQALDRQYGNDTAAWETQVLRAFQTWAVVTPINIGLVSDNGEAAGTAHPLLQPSGKVGAIRIVGFPMSPDVAAVAVPFDPAAGSWSGLVVVNTAMSFGSNGQGQFDLYTVALHEAAHVLGIPHSHDQSSAVYEDYHGEMGGLEPSDIAAVQSVYGPRQPDKHEGKAGNETFVTATPLPIAATGSGVVKADVTTPTDVDTYQFVAPASGGPLTISLQVAGRSLLVPRLSLYSADGRLLDTAAAADPLHNNLSLRLNAATPGSTYFIKVQSAGDDVFDVGRYRLVIAGPNGTGQQSPTNFIGKFLSRYSQTPPGNTLDTALSLNRPKWSSTRPQTSFLHGSTLSTADPVDYFKITNKQSGPRELYFGVWMLGNGSVTPQITIYDQNFRPLNAEVVLQTKRALRVEVEDVPPGATYYVKVNAGPGAKGAFSQGYLAAAYLGHESVDPRDHEWALEANAVTPKVSETLAVTEPQLMQLLLTPDPAEDPAHTSIHVTITRSDGFVWFDRTVPAGANLAATRFADPGVYTIEFQAVTDNGSPLQPVRFTFQATALSDAISPYPEDAVNVVVATPPKDAGSGASPAQAGNSLQFPVYEPIGNPYWIGPWAAGQAAATTAQLDAGRPVGAPRYFSGIHTPAMGFGAAPLPSLEDAVSRVEPTFPVMTESAFADGDGSEPSKPSDAGIGNTLFTASPDWALNQASRPTMVPDWLLLDQFFAALPTDAREESSSDWSARNGFLGLGLPAGGLAISLLAWMIWKHRSARPFAGGNSKFSRWEDASIFCRSPRSGRRKLAPAEAQRNPGKAPAT